MNPFELYPKLGWSNTDRRGEGKHMTTKPMVFGFGNANDS